MPRTLFHIFLLGLIIFLATACRNPDKRLLDPGLIPADNSIPEITVRNFVSRASICLLGFGPKPAALDSMTHQLQTEGFRTGARIAFLQKLMNRPEYNQILYQQEEANLLNFIFNPDSAEIEHTIGIWKQQPSTAYNLAEIERLRNLQRIPRDLDSGTLSTSGLQKRLAFNSYYDFVNMGTENFVVSMFENFLHRYPTAAELKAGKQMVDGNPSLIFGKKGDSKAAFVDIFFECPEYFEGQVRSLFRQLLLREPTSEEMARFTALYYKKRDYRSLQISLMASDEFAQL
jgi:hypothetical protein